MVIILICISVRMNAGRSVRGDMLTCQTCQNPDREGAIISVTHMTLLSADLLSMHHWNINVDDT